MNPRLVSLIFMVLVLAAFRLIPHPPNVTPIAAMALFAGAQFGSRTAAFMLPLVALLLSDIILGFYSSMVFVYTAFMITVVIGFWLKHRVTPVRVLSAALVSSVLFFLVTNYGAWLTLDMYPKTPEGLLSAYVAGIPFFRNSVFGDLGYTMMVFGAFYLVERYIPSVRVPQISPRG
jgi:hypothetical protein